MALRLVFLGRLADLADAGECEVAASSGAMNWSDIVGWIAAHVSPELAEQVSGEKVRVALDGVVVEDKTAIRAPDGAEIAFLPPVSGG